MQIAGINFNRHVRRKLAWLSHHTTPKAGGKPGDIERTPRSAEAFAITQDTHPRKVQRWLRRGG